MKKLSTLVLASAIIGATLSGAALAQQGDDQSQACQGPGKMHHMGMMHHRGDRMGDEAHRLQFMQKSLGLTDDQVAKVKDIFASHKADREAIQKQEMALRDSIRSEVDAVLTPEQKAKIQAHEDKREANLEKRIQQMQQQLDTMKAKHTAS